MDEEIIKSWKKNADEWVKVIDAEKIESRIFTNAAIFDLLQKPKYKKIVDMGCGEGWLTRKLVQSGKQAIGIDAIQTLLDNARSKGSEPYYRMSFQDIIEKKEIPRSPFDAAVFNFCLYQKNGVDRLLKNTRNSLTENGEIILQTLHPYFLIKRGLEYKSQMVSDSWSGLPGNFQDGHHWYARTFQDWVQVLLKAGLKLTGVKEIVDAEKQPISLILLAS